jgi:hypothetical protein
MSVTTVVDEKLCQDLADKRGLNLAPKARSLRGSAQRACLMNVDGTPEERIQGIMAQPAWIQAIRAKRKSEADAKEFHDWLIEENYLPKDTAWAKTKRTRGQARTLDEDEVFRLLDFALNEARIKGARGQVKGQTESMALRVVGNWCVSIGRDADSPKLKELKWPRAAGPFLAAVKLEGRLLVVLYQAAKGSVCC